MISQLRVAHIGIAGTHTHTPMLRKETLLKLRGNAMSPYPFPLHAGFPNGYDPQHDPKSTD